MSEDTREERSIRLSVLEATPAWEWPDDARGTLLAIVQDAQAGGTDRLLAAELVGDFITVNDTVADVLLSILDNAGEPDELRGKAAISLGPALESADIALLDEPEDSPISEAIFHRIQDTLARLYADGSLPKLVRRRILEAAVRAPQDWHTDAIRAAYASDDTDWQMTAVFCMQFIRGFKKEIIESLKSRHPDIHLHAVEAAGNWELRAAWNHIAGLVKSHHIDKFLLIAAIDAASSIDPQKTVGLISPLLDSDDEDIVEAVEDAMAMAEIPEDDEY